MPTHDNMSQVWLNVKSLSEIQTIDSNEDYIGVYETLVTITYRTFRTSLTWIIIFHPLIHFHVVYRHYLSYVHLTLLHILFKSLESTYYFFMYPFCVALKLDLPTWSAKLQPLVEIHIQQKVGLVRRVF